MLLHLPATCIYDKYKKEGKKIVQVDIYFLVEWLSTCLVELEENACHANIK